MTNIFNLFPYIRLYATFFAYGLEAYLVRWVISCLSSREQAVPWGEWFVIMYSTQLNAVTPLLLSVDTVYEFHPARVNEILYIYSKIQLIFKIFAANGK